MMGALGGWQLGNAMFGGSTNSMGNPTRGAFGGGWGTSSPLGSHFYGNATGGD